MEGGTISGFISDSYRPDCPQQYAAGHLTTIARKRRSIGTENEH
jgi:hypothetical protein